MKPPGTFLGLLTLRCANKHENEAVALQQLRPVFVHSPMQPFVSITALRSCAIVLDVHSTKYMFSAHVYSTVQTCTISGSCDALIACQAVVHVVFICCTAGVEAGQLLTRQGRGLCTLSLFDDAVCRFVQILFYCIGKPVLKAVVFGFDDPLSAVPCDPDG